MNNAEIHCQDEELFIGYLAGSQLISEDAQQIPPEKCTTLSPLGLSPPEHQNASILGLMKPWGILHKSIIKKPWIAGKAQLDRISACSRHSEIDHEIDHRITSGKMDNSRASYFTTTAPDGII